ARGSKRSSASRANGGTASTEARRSSWRMAVVFMASPRVPGRSVDLGLGGGLARLQEVEVAALIGLGDVPGVDGAVAALVVGHGRRPGGPPGRQFGLVHQQRQGPRRHVEADVVAVLDQGQGTANEGL